MINFCCNPNFYSEGQRFNTCLNRKIAVSNSGEIKNCPSMNNGYGNIKDHSLSEVVEKKEYRRYWEINKNDIDVCRDCEFRYVCQDCRAFITDSSNLFSKPSKCNYDPYKGTWM